MKTSTWILGIAVVAFVCGGTASAGECTRSDDFYLDALEAGTSADPIHDLGCVGLPRKLHARWGIAAERKQLDSKRESPHRDRIIAVAGRLVGDDDVGRVAALVLAFQGVGSAGESDVFALVSGSRNSPFSYLRWYALAALQDPRTVAFAERQYGELRGGDERLSTGRRSELLEIVDCLLHLQRSGSRRVLATMVAQEPDAEMKAYIEKAAGL